MITADSSFLDMISSPVRYLKARVELYENGNSTLLDTFYYTDRLKSLTIERVGEESKFFGFGVCQKLNIKLLDANRELNITTANNFEVVFGTDNNYIYTCPIFYVTEVHRDENTNELSITAYDGLYEATKHTVSELALTSAYKLKDFAAACATLLGFPIKIIGADESFNLAFTSDANFDGTESIREALNAIAEATQTIYFIDSQWTLTFKRLDINGEPVYDITKDCYYALKSGENRRLAAICHATELGDNITASLSISGTTQYIRNNPFWELREDIADLVDSALTAIGGITINQFECSWRGNFLLEIGDKIGLITKDNKKAISYLLDDVITYDGSLSEATRWNYIENESETESNPTSLGDVIKRTYARVDKVNKQIELLASETANNYENISSLQLNTESITASVQEMVKETSDSLGSMNDDIATLNNKVEAAMTAENVKVVIQSELESGVEKITTRTGFTFDDVGLTIDKTGTEMSTTITEDGMTVYRDNTAMLVANNVGVEATNLYAKTYLIIGNNSRIEDYGSNRTACFWIAN